MVLVFLGFMFNRLVVTRKQKATIEQAHITLREQHEKIQDSIKYAKRIQNAILPPKGRVEEFLPSSFIFFSPKDVVAGDFYWLEYKNGKILFAACDCTGHGVPGAMVSVICNNGLNRSVREHGLTDPGRILDKTREIVIQEFEKSEEEVKDGMDVALCAIDENQLHFAGAHNPLWIVRDGDLLEIKGNKQPIGKSDSPKPYTTHTTELKKGDNVYVFSDGLQDQFGGPNGKKFMSSRFKKLILDVSTESMDKQKDIIQTAFNDWKGEEEQIDDICVIGVRI